MGNLWVLQAPGLPTRNRPMATQPQPHTVLEELQRAAAKGDGHLLSPAAVAAVVRMAEAAEYAAHQLHEYGAPTRPQRQQIIARLRTSIADMGGEV